MVRNLGYITYLPIFFYSLKDHQVQFVEMVDLEYIQYCYIDCLQAPLAYNQCHQLEVEE
jgi:hypothetical protein